LRLSSWDLVINRNTLKQRERDKQRKDKSLKDKVRKK